MDHNYSMRFYTEILCEYKFSIFFSRVSSQPLLPNVSTFFYSLAEENSIPRVLWYKYSPGILNRNDLGGITKTLPFCQFRRIGFLTHPCSFNSGRIKNVHLFNPSFG